MPRTTGCTASSSDSTPLHSSNLVAAESYHSSPTAVTRSSSEVHSGNHADSNKQTVTSKDDDRTEGTSQQTLYLRSSLPPQAATVSDYGSIIGSDTRATESDLYAMDRQIWEDFDGVPVEVGDYSPVFSWKKLWRYTGPGWMMSIAYIDPGNLESDLQTGVVAGYKLIWLLFLSHALGLFVQILASRIGTATGRHLAQQCRDNYPRWMTFCLWIFAELAIIGSDIQEVIGSAIALRLLLGVSMWQGILAAAMIGYVTLAVQRSGVRLTELLFMSMIGVVVVCFLIEAHLSHPRYREIAEGLLIPRLPSKAMVQAVGMIGAVIMPHNLFLHSALVQSRRIPRGNESQQLIREANFYYALESAGALLISFIINASIVTVFANTYHYQTSIGSMSRPEGNGSLPGLYDAAEVLLQLFGKAGPLLWALGLLSAGESSTMTGTMAGQFVMEGMLNLRISPFYRMLVTRSISLIPTMIIGILATNYLDLLGEWLNVLQSVQLPFAMYPLLQISQSRAIMGSFASRPLASGLGKVMTIGLICLNIYLLSSGVYDLFLGQRPVLGVLSCMLVAVYIVFLVKLAHFSF